MSQITQQVEHKLCRKCGVILDATNWYVSFSFTNNKVCKSCWRTEMKERRLANPEPRERRRRWLLAFNTCRVCGTLLTDSNWFSSFKKKHSYICKPCLNLQRTKWSHPKKTTEQQRNYRRLNSEKVKAITVRYLTKIKLATLVHYSGQNPPRCADPFGQHREPYEDIRALTIDHKAGGGTRHRKIEGYTNIYRWLKMKGYPLGYQVLCANCQLIKRIENHESGNPNPRRKESRMKLDKGELQMGGVSMA